MTVTIRPIRCPHGSALLAGTVPATYEDNCQASDGAPVPFWCGLDEMSKPHGIVIYEGQYLRDWADALVLNAGDDLLDEANDGCVECGAPLGVDCRPNCIVITEAIAHGEYLGEVPWTDRVED